jgi:hypothetical protein
LKTESLKIAYPGHIMQCLQQQEPFWPPNILTAANILALFLYLISILLKKGIVTNDLGRMLLKGKDLRQDGDYKDFVETSMEEAQEQYDNAEKFIVEIEGTLAHLGYQV